MSLSQISYTELYLRDVLQQMNSQIKSRTDLKTEFKTTTYVIKIYFKTSSYFV